MPTTLLTDVEVVEARNDASTNELVLTLHHAQLGQLYEHRTRGIVAATGYHASVSAFLAPIADRLRFDANGQLAVRRHYTAHNDGRLHVLNGEEHTHGVTAPDLGFGPWRASVVLAAVTGREPYPIEDRIAFQTFGLPDSDAGTYSEPSGFSPAEAEHQ